MKIVFQMALFKKKKIAQFVRIENEIKLELMKYYEDVQFKVNIDIQVEAAGRQQ